MNWWGKKKEHGTLSKFEFYFECRTLPNCVSEKKTFGKRAKRKKCVLGLNGCVLSVGDYIDDYKRVIKASTLVSTFSFVEIVAIFLFVLFFFSCCSCRVDELTWWDAGGEERRAPQRQRLRQVDAEGRRKGGAGQVRCVYVCHSFITYT